MGVSGKMRGLLCLILKHNWVEYDDSMPSPGIWSLPIRDGFLKVKVFDDIHCSRCGKVK